MSETKRINPLLIAAPIIAIIAVIVIIELFLGKANIQNEEKPATISVQQAQAAMRQSMPNMTVESVTPSPVEGIWEIIVVTPQGKRIGYIDVEGKYLISGSLIDLSSGTDMTRERFAELSKVDFASISLDDAIVMGNPNAAKKVVVFDDPD